MKNREIEEKLKTALNHSVPDVLGSVLSKCEKQERKIIPMEAEKARTGGKRRRWIPLGSVAAIMLLVAGAFYGVSWSSRFAVDAVIGIDVNPSVELQVNKNEKVLQALAFNEDGKDVLDGMNLKGTDLDVAVNALIGSMLKHGYIDDLANSILITVGNEDAERGAELQSRLMAEVNKILSSNSIEGAILSQNLTSDQNIKSLAEKYKISEGKAALIQGMVEANSLWSFDELSKLTINELNLMAESNQAGLKNIETKGTASDKAYIGEEKARELALKKAGVSPGDASKMRVKFDWEDGRAVYEVEFYKGAVEYECDVDALTGEIRSFERDEEHSSQNGVSLEVSGGGGAGYIGEAKAKQAALKHAGLSPSQAAFQKVKLDHDDGRMIYEVDFYSGNTKYKYELDALTGNVLSADVDKKDEDDRPASGAVTNGGGKDSCIGESEAKSIALSRAPGASIKKIKLDNEDGRMVYELKLKDGGSEHEVEIDGVTGEILKWKSSQQDRQDHEDQDDDEDEDDD